MIARWKGTLLGVCICVAMLPAACSGGSGGDGDSKDTYSDTEGPGGGDTGDAGTARDGDDERPDGRDGPDGVGDADETDGGGEDGPHLCPAGESCLVYSQNDFSAGSSDSEGAGALWFVDPSDPGGRVNLSGVAGATGLVIKVEVGPNGRYVLFNQQPSPSESRKLYVADLAEEDGPEVQAVYETYGSNFGAGPNGDFLWMETPGGGALKVAEAETPSDWKTVPKSVPGEDGELSSMHFAYPDPVSSDGKWIHFIARFLPTSEQGGSAFAAIYRVGLGQSLGSPERLFDPRDYNYTTVADWGYYPSTNRIIATAEEDRGPGKTDPYAMPAEPGAEQTKIGTVRLDQAPYRDFSYGEMSPDGSKLGLFFLESDTEIGTLADGTVIIRFVEPSQPDSELGSVELSYGHVAETVWSADGSELVVSIEPFSANSDEGSPKIWHVDTETYQKTDLTGQVPVAEIGSGVIQDFGPDGKFYFRTNELTGFSEGVGIFRLELPGGDIEQINGLTDTAVGAFVFSADGEQIFYKTDTDYAGAYNLVAAPIDDPKNGTILNQKTEHEDEFVRHLDIVGAK